MLKKLRHAIACFIAPEFVGHALAHDELLAEIGEIDQAAYHEGYEAGLVEAASNHSDVFSNVITWLTARGQLRDVHEVGKLSAAELLEALDSHERRLFRGVVRQAPALVSRRGESGLGEVKAAGGDDALLLA